MNKSDLIGQIFGYLEVKERAGSQNNHALWKCLCRCGKTVIATTGDLRQGKTKSCGCYKKELSSNNYIDETGKTYGRLTVEKRVGTTQDGKALWLCKCSCGNKIVTIGKSLRNGSTKSCGCYNKERISDTSLHDLTGMKFGMLTVLKRAQTKFSKLGNPTTRWICLCDCGNTTTVAANALTTGHTRSCGCIKSSFREEEIEKELRSFKINYQREYIFDDLLSDKGLPLRFDFALIDNDGKVICLIEHQGQQHYQSYANGFGDVQREITDKLKKKYCSLHNILLYEIRYDEDIHASLIKILSEINTLYVNSVPSFGSEEG